MVGRGRRVRGVPRRFAEVVAPGHRVVVFLTETIRRGHGSHTASYYYHLQEMIPCTERVVYQDLSVERAIDGLIGVSCEA